MHITFTRDLLHRWTSRTCVLLVVLLVGTIAQVRAASKSSPRDQDTRMIDQTSVRRTTTVSPLTTRGATLGGIKLVDCIRLELSLNNVVADSGTISGNLLARSKCAVHVAVLLSPIEIRVCGVGQTCFYEGPLLRGNVYARLYVFPEDNGSPLEFKGQFSLRVLGPPQQGTIEPGATRLWRVTGSSSLLEGVPAGSYQAFIETYGSPIAPPSYEDAQELVLGLGVREHNQRSGDYAAQVFLSPSAQLLPCKVASFQIRD